MQPKNSINQKLDTEYIFHLRKSLRTSEYTYDVSVVLPSGEWKTLGEDMEHTEAHAFVQGFDLG